MKTRTFLLSLLLSLTALAFVPSTEAAEIPGPVVCVTDPCPPYPTPTVNWCTLEAATPGPNPYYTPSLRELLWGNDAGCDVDAEGPEMICAPPSSTGIDQSVGPVHVDAAVCDGGIPDRLPPITIVTASAEPAIDVDTRDYYACAPPSGFVVERTVGPVHVAVLVCDGGIPDQLPELTAAAMQPPIYCVMAPCPGPYPPPAFSWCGLKSTTPAEARALVWGTDAGCDVDVETNWYCLYNEVPVDRTVGPVHVVTRICTPDVQPVQ